MIKTNIYFPESEMRGEKKEREKKQTNKQIEASPKHFSQIEAQIQN